VVCMLAFIGEISTVNVVCRQSYGLDDREIPTLTSGKQAVYRGCIAFYSFLSWSEYMLFLSRFSFHGKHSTQFGFMDLCPFWLFMLVQLILRLSSWELRTR
jgi:hypothetical protein